MLKFIVRVILMCANSALKVQENKNTWNILMFMLIRIKLQTGCIANIELYIDFR